MDAVNIDLWTFDVGVDVGTPQEYARQMSSRVRESWDSGADIVIFPEYAWMGLERFVKGGSALPEVATLFWDKVWPEIQAEFCGAEKAAVLGTVPFVTPEGGIRNRAPVWCAGQAGYQDKIHLTPWERGLTGGTAIQMFSLHGIRFAVIVCLDIEIPELSVRLRREQVDLLLVPSATENILGVERIRRCASARAVELGCCVGVSQLVGRTESELVDENVGRLGWFTPSQASFADISREDVSPLFTEGFHSKRCVLEKSRLDTMRTRRAETNPSLLKRYF